MLLKDKIVVVSGIGPGLGVELLLQAADQGAAGVAICARTASKLDEAEAAVREQGLQTPILKVPTDIADPAACRALVEQAQARFGRIDVLLNSAYVPGKFEPVESADLDDWRKTLDINLFGTLNLTQAVIPVMKQQGSGAIVMVNTMVTRKPMPWQGGYGASKAALVSATSHLALELGRYGIRVNATFMGWMWGPSVENYFKAEAERNGTTVDALRKGVARNIPLGDIPEDGDCAKAVIFLASDYARAITGACLDVNGGEYLPH